MSPYTRWTYVLACTAIASAPSIAQGTADEEAVEPVEEAVEAALPLEEFLRHFLAADPTWKATDVEMTIAALAVERSRDNREVDLFATPSAGYDLYGTWDGASPSHQGTFAASSAGATIQDDKGGAWTISADLAFYTDPNLTEAGHQLGAGVEYALPMLRNAQGKMWALETAWREVEQQATETDSDAFFLERCAIGAEMYLVAYYLQEQTRIWEDLLVHKEKTYDRTKADYNRRMLPRLDYLTAKSDWLAAQQRHEELRGLARQAKASLATYLGEDGADARLADPSETLEVEWTDDALAGRFADHPLARTYEHLAAAYEAEGAYFDRTFRPEISLVPAAGVGHFTHLKTGAGSTTPMTDIFALLSVSFDLPLRKPARAYQALTLAERRRQAELQRDEVVRSLAEQAAVAQAAVDAADAQLALTEAKLEVVQTQIDEAGARFNTGQLEFQDYLQHWAAYEGARFERVGLQYTRWSAQVDLMRALDAPPAACQRGE